MSDENTETQDQSAAAARIRQLVSRVKELEGKVAEVSPMATEAEKLRAQVAEWETRYAAAEGNFQLERKLLTAGFVDEEARDIVTWAYERLPKENRPALEEWLANRDGLPRAVRAYLSESSVSPAAAKILDPVVSKAMPPPKPSTGTIPQAPSEPQSWTPEAIARLSPAEFKANREAIFAALRTG